MTLIPLRYVHRFRDRHGKVRHYLRRPGAKRVPLPGEPGTEAFLAAYRAAMAETDPPAPRRSSAAPGSFDALIPSYYASTGFAALRPSTRAAYRRIVEELRPRLGHRVVAQMREEHVRKLMAEKQGHPTAANHLLRMLRHLMKHAKSLRLMAADPTRDVDRLPYRTSGFAPWTEADIALYEARWPSGTKQRLALALLLYTCQRRSDVVRMGRQHLAWHPDDDGHPYRAIEIRQKKARDDAAPVHVPVLPQLAAEIDRVPEGQLTFLLTEQGKPYTPGGFYNAFREWADQAGVPKNRSPHGLRKAGGRRLAEGGCTSRQIAAVLGHKTLSEGERYTRDAEQKRLARAGIVRLPRGGG